MQFYFLKMFKNSLIKFNNELHCFYRKLRSKSLGWVHSGTRSEKLMHLKTAIETFLLCHYIHVVVWPISSLLQSCFHYEPTFRQAAQITCSLSLLSPLYIPQLFSVLFFSKKTLFLQKKVYHLFLSSRTTFGKLRLYE